MIVISRQRDETIKIGDDIEVTVVDNRGDKVRQGIMYPKEISVHRREVYDAIRRETGRATVSRAPMARLLASEAGASSHVSIRAAKSDDLHVINEIYNYYVLHTTCTYQEDPEPMDGRREWLARHGKSHPVTVAEQNGRIVGWGSLSPFHSRCAYRNTVENSVYVEHGFHRRGIGSMILKDLIDRGKAIGHRAIIALIDADQSGSIAMHERLGFQHVGRLKQVGFKFGRWLDVVYMQLLL
jgi:phosphinothricin acetyltransferase